jgi:hypothetical protein
MNSPQNKGIHDNLTPLPTSWHNYPICCTQLANPLHTVYITSKSTKSQGESPCIYMSNQLFPCDSNYDQVHKFGFLGRILPIFVYVFEYEMSHLHQELHIQTSFASLLHHMSMLLSLPLYALEGLGFTLNHVAPR